LVIGIEADIDAADITHSSSNCVQTVQGAVVACGTRSSSLDDFGTVRGRLGYAINNLLLYGTGGWAWGDASSTLGINSPFSQTARRVSSSPDGWSAGGGIEWGFMPNWSVRAEYLHLQFDGIREAGAFSGTVGGVPASVATNVKADLGVDIARVGLTYKFNWF
jgi:outer membrane immunogenic protein